MKTWGTSLMGEERTRYWKFIFYVLLTLLLFMSTPNIIEGSTEKAYASETVMQQNVDLNAASLEQLKRLDGIGDVLAQRITENRPYEKVEDLLKVKGIGDKTLAKIQEQGLAVVEGQKLIVNRFADDTQILSGKARQNAMIKIYINDVLNNSVLTDNQGIFTYDIGFVDADINKIKVEEWKGGILSDKLEFAVEKSGNVNYFVNVLRNSSVYTVNQNTLLDSSSSFQAALNSRYIGLVKEAKLKISTSKVAYQAEYTTIPDTTGNIVFSIKPTYYATYAGKQIRLGCEAIDSRKILHGTQEVYNEFAGAEPPVAKDFKVLYQNSQLSYSGLVSSGTTLSISMGSRDNVRNEQPVPFSPDLPEYTPFTMTTAKNEYTEYLGKYNIPMSIRATTGYPVHSIDYVQVQDQDINQPPARVFGNFEKPAPYVVNGYFNITGIPNSTVKVKLKAEDFNGEAYDFWITPQGDREFSVTLDKNGNADVHGLNYGELGYDMQHYKALYVANVVGGKLGQENKLNLVREDIENKNESINSSYFNVYAIPKEALIK